MFEQLIKAILDRIGIPKQEDVDILSQKTEKLLRDIEKLKAQLLKSKENKKENKQPAQ